jgi:UDP-MurNAc hydroxylase
MELTFLRGACVIIEASGQRLLCDPWLTDGEYYGAWAHYPPFLEQDWAPHEFHNIDLIYVSHIHPDHFSIPTMQKLKELGCKAPVVIHRYPVLPAFRKQIEACGFDVIELAHGETHSFGRARIRIFSADGCDPKACGSFYGCTMPGVINSQIDSLAVIQDYHGRAIVNVNDCPYALSRDLCRKLAIEYPDIDLALVAYAGAGPYPQCFKMPELKKLDEAKRKRAEFIKNVSKFARTLNAKQVFPFAGDYQLCGKLSTLNEVRGVPSLDDVVYQLTEDGIDCLTIAPGNTVTIGDSSTDIDNILYADDAARAVYVVNELAKRKLDYENDDLDQDPASGVLFQEAFERFDAKRREYGMKCSSTAYIKMMEGQWFAIEPDHEGYMTDRIVQEPYVSISTDKRLLKRLLLGPRNPYGAHWNNAQIGSHLTFDRQPLSLYEPGLYHLLSYFHA